jgi:hypothetical protein
MDLHSNPASVGALKNMGITGTHLMWFLNSGYSNFAFAFRPKESNNSFAISMMGFGIAGIEERNADGELQGTFGAQDYAVGFSYGRRSDTLYTLCYGITVKYLQQKISDDVAHGYCMDAGFLYKIPESVRLRSQAIPSYVGVALTSLGPGLQRKTPPLRVSEEFTPPMKAKIGTAYKLRMGERVTSLISVEGVLSLSNGYHALAMGMEININEMFLLRGGVRQIMIDAEDFGQINRINYGVGCGFKVSDFLIDYVYYFHNLQNTQGISASLEF